MIVRDCFDRTHGLNKLFLHLIRALCLCLIMISHLVIFPCILLTRNHMIFLVKFGNKQALVNFFKDHKLLVFKKIYSCLFIPNCTQNYVITYTNRSVTHWSAGFVLFVFFSKDLKSLHSKELVRYLTDISTVFNNFFP